jgi:integrase
MKREKLCILPKLHDWNGDIRKQWFVFFSYRNPADGKMKRFRIYDGFTDCRTKKAKLEHGDKLVASFSHKLKTGWNPFHEEAERVIYTDNLQYATLARAYSDKRQSNKTFSYFANLFLHEMQGSARKTYQNYVSKYRAFNSFLENKGLGGNDITTITQPIVADFFMFLIEDPRMRLARITLKKYEHMLARVFDWMVKNKHIRQSPVFDLPDTRRKNDQAPRPIHEGDINILVEEIKSDRQLYLTIQLEYYCFLRPGLEIRLARVGWFDLAASRIYVPGEVVKTEQDKVVIIPEDFRKYLLKEWKLINYPTNYFLIGQNGMPGPVPLGQNNLRNRFNIIRDRLHLPTTYKLYSWKHTGNCRAEDAGIPMAARQRQNGHSSMRSTEEYLKNKIGFRSPEIEKNFPALEKKPTRTHARVGSNKTNI